MTSHSDDELLVEHLEAGGQGSVSIFVHQGTLCAMKRIPARRKVVAQTEDRAVSELHFDQPWANVEYSEARFEPFLQLRRINNKHVHIARCIDKGYLSDGDFAVFMELGCSDLHDVLCHSAGCRTGEASFAREWLLQLAHALAYCHKSSVAVSHRDVKPENVLIFKHPPGKTDSPQPGRASPSELLEIRTKLRSELFSHAKTAHVNSESRAGMRQFMIKLCDFGSALIAERGAAKSTRGRSPHGSSLYSAPEVAALQALRSQKPKEANSKPWSAENTFAQRVQTFGYDAQKADVWSYGITVYKVVFGDVPFATSALNNPKFRAFVRSTQPEVLGDAMCAPESSIWQEAPEHEWAWPRRATPALVHLLSNCLRIRPAERFSMQQVKSHNWFATPRWEPPAGEPAILNKQLESAPQGIASSAVVQATSLSPPQSPSVAAEPRAERSDTVHSNTPASPERWGASGSGSRHAPSGPSSDGSAAAPSEGARANHGDFASGPVPMSADRPPRSAPAPHAIRVVHATSTPAASASGGDSVASQYTPSALTPSSSLHSAPSKVLIPHLTSSNSLTSPAHSDARGTVCDGARQEVDATQRSQACMTVLPLQSQSSFESGSASPAVWQGSAGGSPQNGGDSSTSWSSSPSRSMAAGIGGSLPYSGTDEFATAYAEEASAWNSPLASGTPSNQATPSSAAHPPSLSPNRTHGENAATKRTAEHGVFGTAAAGNRPGRASSSEAGSAAAANAVAAASKLGVVRPGARRRAASAGSLSALPAAVQAAAVAAGGGGGKHGGLTVDTARRHPEQRMAGVAPAQPPLIDLPPQHGPGFAQASLRLAPAVGAELCTVAERGESMDK